MKQITMTVKSIKNGRTLSTSVTVVNNIQEVLVFIGKLEDITLNEYAVCDYSIEEVK